MDTTALEKLLVGSESVKAWAGQFQHKRYLFDRLANAGSDFYVGVRGIRGIGKTTLLLQVAKSTNNSVYFSADYKYLAPYHLYDIANALRKRGITTLFIDEIHTRPGWQTDIKTLYDEHELRIFFSGSSGMDIRQGAADLSRRAVIHDLKPVSFREYLNIRKGFLIPAYSLNEVLSKGRDISLKNIRASEYMEEYTRFGGVLYSGEGFSDALGNSIEKTIVSDLAALRNINLRYENDAYRLLYHVAVSRPFETNFSSLSEKLGVSKTFAIRLISDLCLAGLLKSVFPCRGDKHDVKKEPKIFLTIPFRSFFTQEPDKGAVREEFFVNHAPVSCYLKTERGAKTPDFMVEKNVVEVGGASKSFGQKPDYIAADSALWEERKIPLFLFGLLY